MSETKLQPPFLSGNFEYHITLREMQQWLGHERSKTTTIYSHVFRDSFTKFKIRLSILTLMMVRT